MYSGLFFHILFSVLLNTSEAPYRIESVDGTETQLEGKSIVVIANTMNCLGCFNVLSDLCKSGKSDADNVYVLFDSKAIQPFERYQRIETIKKNFAFRKAQFVFLSHESPNTFSESFSTCDQSKSPYMILINGELSLAMCHEEIFSETSNDDAVRAKIHSFFANN